MDNILITVNFMKLGIFITIPLAIIGIITTLIDNRFISFFFNLVKCFFYGGLATYMYIYITRNSIQEIGMVTAFTFIFCCFECGDNFVKIFSDIIKLIRHIKKIVQCDTNDF